MILGIIYETISNAPVGYVLTCTPTRFGIRLYSTDGYVHSQEYKTRHFDPSNLHWLMDKSTPMRHETE